MGSRNIIIMMCVALGLALMVFFAAGCGESKQGKDAKGSGNKNVTRSINLYDLHLSYSKEVLKQFSDIGVKCGILPFGYELDTITYDAIKIRVMIMEM